MDEKLRSPKITKISWGRIEVEGQTNPYKDAKLYPGGSREWDWRETGTEHKPGIQPTDVDELLEKGADVIVLSSGVYGRLKVATETLNSLHDQGIIIEVHKTPKAVQRYNQLAETESVGALIHSTC
jgi:hypothetical protein